ncbi:hypothetical protein WH52_02515 [Tenacibaculum holothuriorum]|uniref:histidine kinase n=2 Tax=Tenacibaculum holothuriorum TaxID=1635173 RepID=A0A1Y2PGG9_9FLAO|nr:hypothetical protein WH52_02515 [Tenacibaculum holothuriorum]
MCTYTSISQEKENINDSILSESKKRGKYFLNKMQTHNVIDSTFFDSIPYYYKKVKKNTLINTLKDSLKIDIKFLFKYEHSMYYYKYFLGGKLNSEKVNKFENNLLAFLSKTKRINDSLHTLKANYCLFLFYSRIKKDFSKSFHHYEKTYTQSNKLNKTNYLVALLSIGSNSFLFKGHDDFRNKNLESLGNLLDSVPNLFTKDQKIAFYESAVTSDTTIVNSNQKINYLHKMLKLNPTPIGKAYTFNSLGIRYHYEKKKRDSAEYYYKKALTVSNKISGKEKNVRKLPVWINLTDLYFSNNDIKKASIYFDSIAKSGNNKVTFSEFDNFDYYTKALADGFYTLGNYKKASDYYKLYQKNIKETYKEEEKKLSIELTDRIKNIEKDKEIAEKSLLLEKQKTQQNLYIFLGFLILLITIFFFTYRLFKVKNKKIYSEKLLKEQNKLFSQRSEFIENVAHEIKTPLTIIKGNIEKILKDSNLTKEQTHLLLPIVSNAINIDKDINDIVNSFNNKEGYYTINLTTVNVNSFTKDLQNSFISHALQNGIALKEQTTITKNTYLKFDSDKVQQIVSNFITNAIKYSNSKEIILKSDLNINTNLLSISVVDFGIGISKEEQEKVFERFYQGSGNNIGGFGIGLSLAKKLAEFLGGKIVLNSQPNKQTSFTLQIPVLITEQQKAVDNTVQKINSNTSLINLIENKKFKLLIVDDNLDILNFYKQILPIEYECFYAANGLEGIKLAKKQNFDLIISDIMMPKIDGFKFRELIKELPNHAYTPFIFVSAKNNLSDKINALNLGVDDYITKPFHIDELLARINNSLLLNKNRKQWKIDNPEETESIVDDNLDPIIEKAIKIISKNLTKENFSVEELAKELNYSTRQLSRIFSKTVGLSPVKFILEQRLKKAYLLLKEHSTARVSEVQYQVGINHASYFNKKFKERFGISPSELIK